MCRRLVLSLVALLWIVSAAKAQGNSQSTFEILRQMRMTTTLDITNSAGTSDMTLDWAYADEHQLAVAATVSGLAPNTLYYPQVSLIDMNRNEFTLSSSSFSLNGDGVTFELLATFYATALTPDNLLIENYFADQYTDLPDEIDLRLAVQINDTLNYGIFDFSVPLYAAFDMHPMMIQQVNGMDMDLQSVSITPSQTHVVLCFAPPDEQDWLPNAQLALNSTQATLSNIRALDGTTTFTDRSCYELAFDIFYDNLEITTLRLVIPRLVIAEPTESPEYWSQVEAALAEQNIDVDVSLDNGLSIQPINLPEGMSDEEFNQTLIQTRQDLREDFAGPWVFTVPLP